MVAVVRRRRFDLSQWPTGVLPYGSTGLSDAHLTDAMSAANRVFAYSRLSDYTPIKRESIARRRLFVSFQTELSSVKVTCFMALYRSLPMPPTTPRLDVIVLTNDAPYSRLSPPTTLLKKNIQDQFFRVFVRTVPSDPPKDELHL